MNYKIYPVGGFTDNEVSLLVTPAATALVDSGYAFSAEIMIARVKEILGDRPLDLILLTHSHYDHASGSAYCRRVWPEVKVVAHPRVAYTFTRPGAIATMRHLNDSSAALCDHGDYVDRLDELRVDIQVSDGDHIKVGELDFTVIETPGHTRDSIVFWCEAEKLLLTCETLGMPMPQPGRPPMEMILPCAMVGWQMTLDAIAKTQRLEPEHMLISHAGLFSGDDCREFFKSSLYWLEQCKTALLRCRDEGGTVEDMVKLQRRMFYDGIHDMVQPLDAFLLNAEIRTRMLLREFPQ